MLRLRTADGRGCGSLSWEGGCGRGCRIPVCDQEEQSSCSKLDLLGVHPGGAKACSLPRSEMLSEKNCSASTAESSFLQRLMYLIFWHQNATKQCIQNCMKLTRPWFQSTDKLYSLQTSISGWGSGKFFHHWHPQICRVLRNSSASASLVVAQRETGYILALWKQDFNHFPYIQVCYFS